MLYILYLWNLYFPCKPLMSIKAIKGQYCLLLNYFEKTIVMFWIHYMYGD